ncbi:MAG: DUF4199 domain-containing protein [Chitinophagaceae bacterium]|nr:DUF4199 domain-containing protein [Chitinophagaceae bacterium]
METKVTTPVVKGLIISMILIVIGLAIYFSGQMANKSLGYLQYLILLGGVIWACINYAKQLNHNVTFGNVFAHGFKTTAVVTVITIVYTVLAFKVLFPEMQDVLIRQAELEMEKQSLSDDQREQAIGMVRNYMVPFAIGGVLFFFMVIGLIGSLIGAAAAKKHPQDPFQQPL